MVQPVATTLRVQQINPTTVEVFFQDNKCMVFDFYGDNIFRMFRDDQGGILRSPSATPPAQILADQPRAKSVNVQATTEGNAAIIQSGKVTIRIDGTSRLMTVTENETGKVLLEEYAPVAFGKGKATLTLKIHEGEYFYGGGVQNGRFSHKGKSIAIENTNN